MTETNFNGGSENDMLTVNYGIYIQSSNRPSERIFKQVVQIFEVKLVKDQSAERYSCS